SLIGRELHRVSTALGTSIVWVTQFLPEALTCPRILAMSAGAICFLGTREEFLERKDVHQTLGIQKPERLRSPAFVPERDEGA
ncbi:MAG: hypothetical protein JSW03_01700, partial [Candidatus Eiseniibacteriota bacterium]